VSTIRALIVSGALADGVARSRASLRIPIRTTEMGLIPVARRRVTTPSFSLGYATPPALLEDGERVERHSEKRGEQKSSGNSAESMPVFTGICRVQAVLDGAASRMGIPRRSQKRTTQASSRLAKRRPVPETADAPARQHGQGYWQAERYRARQRDPRRGRGDTKRSRPRTGANVP
jgi:hypothetical protein